MRHSTSDEASSDDSLGLPLPDWDQVGAAEFQWGPSPQANPVYSDDPFYTVTGNSVLGTYIPATSSGPTTSTSIPGSVVAVSSNGFTINLIFDAAALAAPASFRSGIQQAAAMLAANITDKITVDIKIDYSGTGGGAAAGPDSGYGESYSWVHSMLTSNANLGDTTFNSLPSGSTIQGQSNVVVWNAQLKLWGILGANDTSTDDASATFATDIDPNLLVGVALHELTHAMGRVPYGSTPDVFDFYRFTSYGTRLFQGGSTAPAAYFSLDGGATKIADYGQNSDPSDFLNSGVQGPNDPFNEYYTGSTLQQLTAIDLKQLDALGFHVMSAQTPIVIEAIGATSLTQVGNYYYLNRTASSPGIEVTYNGVPNGSAGLPGSWAAIGAEANAGGYLIAWKVIGSDQYAVWNADSNGNYVSNAIMPTSGSDPALELIETKFQQDLNGDGVIGIHGTTISSQGGTTLTQVGSNYYLNLTPSSLGIEVTYNGVPNGNVGLPGTWAAIGAEANAGGYLIAWKVIGSDQYAVWNADSNGNYVSNAIMPTSGSDPALELIETKFHQDLNGDGVIGIHGTTISSQGGTTLTQVGNNYFLDLTSSSPGHEVTFNGVPMVASPGNWVAIGAEANAGGYLIAWHIAGSDQYAVWNADSNGNYVSNAVMPTSGSSVALEAIETSFQQDLNGDGVIGIHGTTISSQGGTTLTQVGSNYFLDLTSSSPGHEVTFNGVPMVASPGTWAAIGAVANAGGYLIAWHIAGSDQYAVWNADSNGNYVSNAVMPTSGSSVALEAIETSFQQDLNGDGVIGIHGTTISSQGGTTLTQVGSNYFLDLTSSSPGIEVTYNGVPMVASPGTWAAIGAVSNAGGYLIAWHIAGSDQYAVWNADSNGNYVSNAVVPTSGSSVALEAIETSFHQDLNGDGVIGFHGTTIEALGSTSLTELGGNYYLNLTAGSTGPEVTYNGVPMVASSLPGTWTAIGAETNGGGYLIAWKMIGADQYAVWNADSNGNYVSNAIMPTSGTSAAIESIETTFHQDLNGDGVIGLNNPSAVAGIASSFQFNTGSASTPAVIDTSHATILAAEAVQPALTVAAPTPQGVVDHTADLSSAALVDMHAHGFLIQ